MYNVARVILRCSSNIRNIGIIAHVDAGKTTLTEQMLFLSKTISNSGTVDRGTTVTDFMGEERRRGISIKSSLVSFKWGGADINLLDTPGHIDFNYEVECAVSVMDGCVLIIDGCKGIQPQTLKVWRQATKYNLPLIIFANKMDRLSANFDSCIQSVGDKLGLFPVVLYSTRADGTVLDTFNNNECKHYKDSLLSSIAEEDQQFCDSLLEGEIIDDKETRNVLSSLVRGGKISVIIGGSAIKGLGISQLMDCIVEMLPSPTQTKNSLINRLYSTHSDPDVALYVYKVGYSDHHGGFIAFVRVITNSGVTASGLKKMFKMDKFTCWRRLEKVRISAGRLYNVFADEIFSVDDDLCVDFCGIVSSDGIIKTGDIFSTLKEPVKDIFDYSPTQPQRPFHVNIEAADSASDRKLVQILKRVEGEDSSIRVNVDDFLTITVESVGPLHMDVIRNYIKDHHGLSTQIVKTRVSYKESLVETREWCCPEDWSVSKSLGGRDHFVKIGIRFRGSADPSCLSFCSELNSLSTIHRQALRHGFETALQSGPLIGGVVEGLKAEVTSFETSRNCLTSFVVNSMCNYVKTILVGGNVVISEPYQEYEIICGRSVMDVVLADLSTRRGEESSVVYMDNNVRVSCYVPLMESIGYADQLRSITSGLVDLNCGGCIYRPLSPDDQTKIINSL